MKLGDLVRVSFPTGYEKPVLGVFVRDDLRYTDHDKHGDLILTRGFVLWGGEVYSTPFDQMEVINESR